MNIKKIFFFIILALIISFTIFSKTIKANEKKV